MKYLRVSTLQVDAIKGHLSPLDIFTLNLTNDIMSIFLRKNDKLNTERFDYLQMCEEKNINLLVKIEDILQMECDFGQDVRNHNQQIIESYKHELELSEFYQSYEGESLVSIFKQCTQVFNLDEIYQWVDKKIHSYTNFKNANQSQLKASVLSLLSCRDDKSLGALICFIILNLLKEKNEEVILEVLFSYIVKDIGYTQLDKNRLEKDSIFTEQKNQDYKDNKHMFLSLLFFKKFGISLSKNCTRFILEHHEHLDGQGLPRAKKEKYIHRYSNLIGLIDDFMTYHVCTNYSLNMNLKSYCVNTRFHENKYFQEYIGLLRSITV